MAIEQQNNHLLKTNNTFHVDKLILKSNENELILFMSEFPGKRIYHDRLNIGNDLNRINVDTILTLNETKELSLMNMRNNNLYNMDAYSMDVKRANLAHIIYPIRNRFIPKSISDYMQFLYGIIINVNHFNRNRLLVHCMRGLGRTGMTIVCFELLYEYVMNENEKQEEQNIIERFCHYPFLLENYCRVCKAILNVRTTRQGSIRNPLQILFVHEFYARLKSSPYMQQIKNISNLNEKLLLANFEELRLPINL
jgi:protein tyrosine phosphatase